MGLKRERPTSVPPVPTFAATMPPPVLSSSSSSSSGDGAFDDSEMPRRTRSYDPEPIVVGSSAASDASDASGSRAIGSGGQATITTLDLLPKELRRIANATRPDSDIPWTSDDDTCYYYKMDNDRCFHPRTCRDCLEMPGCMINQLGQCVDQIVDRYNGYMDFRLAITKNMSGPYAKNRNASHTQQYHFPAKSVSYCPIDEPTCRYCKRNDFSTKLDSRFCIGAFRNRKCICISICESPVRSEVLVHKNCTNPLSTSTLATELNHPLMSTPSLFTVIVAPIVLVLVAYQIVQRHRRSRSASQDAMGGGAPRSGDLDGDGDAADSIWSWSTSTTAHEIQPERAIPSGRLDLSGWQALRQEMIAKEQLLLAGLETNSPASGWVDFDDLEGEDDTGHRRGSQSLDPAFENSRRSSRGLDETPRHGSSSSVQATSTTLTDRVYWTESDLAML